MTTELKLSIAVALFYVMTGCDKPAATVLPEAQEPVAPLSSTETSPEPNQRPAEIEKPKVDQFEHRTNVHQDSLVAETSEMGRLTSMTLALITILLLGFAYRLAVVLSRDPREDALLEVLAEAAMRADDVPDNRDEDTRRPRFD